MNSEVWIPLLGGSGFLLGIAALLQYWNTRKGTKGKSSADAYTAYSTFVGGAIDQAKAVNEDQAQRLTLGGAVRITLIQLVQDLIAFARTKGATPDELDPFQDRLDEVRAR